VIDWRNETMDDVRLRYLDHLRGVAAGHRSADGMDLARERALTEQVDRRTEAADAGREELGQLVNLASSSSPSCSGWSSRSARSCSPATTS
jgi:hypothetical protein